MFLFYVLSFSKKGDTIKGGTLLKGGHYWRKYGILWYLEQDFHAYSDSWSTQSEPSLKFSWKCADVWQHGLRTPREEIAFTARPKIHSQSHILSATSADNFDLCLHWVSVVRVWQQDSEVAQKCSDLSETLVVVHASLFKLEKHGHRRRYSERY